MALTVKDSWFLDDKKLLVSQGPTCKALQWNSPDEEMLQTSLQGRLSLECGHPVQFHAEWSRGPGGVIVDYFIIKDWKAECMCKRGIINITAVLLMLKTQCYLNMSSDPENIYYCLILLGHFS